MRFGVLLQDRRYEVGGVDPMSPWRGATTAVSCCERANVEVAERYMIKLRGVCL
jgi:hypothetical protein